MQYYNPELVLQATNAGVRRPGNEATSKIRALPVATGDVCMHTSSLTSEGKEHSRRCSPQELGGGYSVPPRFMDL